MAQRLSQTQTLRQGQTLVMTPQLRQSIRLLGMSQGELDAFLQEERQKNPLLRVLSPASSPPTPRRLSAPSDGRIEDVWDRTASPPTLAEHLYRQIAEAGPPAAVAVVAKSIADDLDEAGYLPEPFALARRLGTPLATFAPALRLVRSLEPAGVGALNLADCLSLQLAARDRLDPAMRALVERLDEIAEERMDALRAASGLDAADLADALKELRQLDPRPGRRFTSDQVAPAPPDVLMRESERGGWTVELNPATLPRVLIDMDYHAAVANGLRTPGEREYVARALADANWLVRSLDQRARTTVRVVSAIAAAQDAFFAEGVRALKPLTMQAIADVIGMHESTVSRVVAHRTLLSPQGLLPLRFFFAPAIRGEGGEAHSATAVKDRIRSLVACEGTAILSDDAIKERLRSDGVEIARRTVAKYREAMAIPSSVLRRRALPATAWNRVAAGSRV